MTTDIDQLEDKTWRDVEQHFNFNTCCKPVSPHPLQCASPLEGIARSFLFYLYKYIYVFEYIFIYIHICVYTYIYIHIYTYMHIIVYIYIYICTNTYINIYTYIYRTCYAFKRRSALQWVRWNRFTTRIKVRVLFYVLSRFGLQLIDVNCRAVRSAILCFSLCSHLDN